MPDQGEAAAVPMDSSFARVENGTRWTTSTFVAGENERQPPTSEGIDRRRRRRRVREQLLRGSYARSLARWSLRRNRRRLADRHSDRSEAQASERDLHRSM